MGTCRNNAGIIQKFLNFKKKDKKDIIPRGETYSRPSTKGESLSNQMERLSFCFDDKYDNIKRH